MRMYNKYRGKQEHFKNSRKAKRKYDGPSYDDFIKNPIKGKVEGKPGRGRLKISYFESKDKWERRCIRRSKEFYRGQNGVYDIDKKDGLLSLRRAIR